MSRDALACIIKHNMKGVPNSVTNPTHYFAFWMPVFYRPLSASAVASFRWPSDLEVKNGVASLVSRNAASSRDSFGGPPEVLWAPRSPGSRATHAISYPELPSKLYSSWKWQGEREKLELPCRSPLGSDDRSCCYCNLSLKLLLPFLFWLGC